MTFDEIIKDYNGIIWTVVNKYSIKGWDRNDKYQEAITILHLKYKEYNDTFKFSTFMYTILDNHFKDLVTYSNRKKRCNHITVDGKDITLRDINNYDFTGMAQPLKYTKAELHAINLSRDILKDETSRNQEIIKARLGKATLVSIADTFGISKQRVDFIFKRYIKRVKEML
jgi:RNA polymerase sigma factor (sigma-70 family)